MERVAVVVGGGSRLELGEAKRFWKKLDLSCTNKDANGEGSVRQNVYDSLAHTPAQPPSLSSPPAQSSVFPQQRQNSFPPFLNHHLNTTTNLVMVLEGYAFPLKSAE